MKKINVKQKVKTFFSDTDDPIVECIVVVILLVPMGIVYVIEKINEKIDDEDVAQVFNTIAIVVGSILYSMVLYHGYEIGHPLVMLLGPIIALALSIPCFMMLLVIISIGLKAAYYLLRGICWILYWVLYWVLYWTLKAIKVSKAS
jgi:hypothetical protein